MSILSNRFSSAQIEKLAMMMVAHHAYATLLKDTANPPMQRTVLTFDGEVGMHCEIFSTVEEDGKVHTWVDVHSLSDVHYFNIKDVMWCVDTQTIGEKLVELTMVA